jgi:hypothetical protein
MFNRISAVAFGVFAWFLSLYASASTPYNYDDIIAGANFTNVIITLLAIGAVLAGLYVARKGIYLVLGMLRSKG